jgi:hypothetical protein
VYDCSVRLPYPVIEKQGSAKYDKGTKTLVVTLPVQPHSASLPDAAEDATIDAGSEPGVEADEAKESAPASSAKSKSSSKPVHDRWVSGSEGGSSSTAAETAEESESARLAREIAERAREAQLAYAALKAAEEEEAKARVLTATSNAGADGMTKSMSDNAEEGLDFISAPKFQGAKPGFVFKNGDFGVGYYKDVNGLRAQPEASPAAASPATPVNSVDSPRASSFMFEYRQTRDAVTVLVQVASIVPSSVRASFSASGVHIAFTAAGENDDLVSYGMGLKTTQPINPSECKYDVADMNMVIALFKQTPGYWQEEEALNLPPFAAELQKRLPQPITILIPEETGITLPLQSDDKALGSSDPKPTVSATPSAGAEARSNPSAMRFHAQALLDLD